MEEKHFFVVHTFVSDEARKEFLTPPEKRIPPEKRKTEEEWAKSSAGKFAKCVQKWIGNDEFLYWHWIAKSEQDVYLQLDEWNIEGKILSSMVHEVNEFMSAYRNSDKVLESFPEDGMYW